MAGRIRRLAYLVAAGALLTAPACTSKGAGASDPTERTVKVAAVASGPFTHAFNPLIQGYGNANGYAGSSIFQPLLQDDFANGKNRPWLAQSFNWGQDGKTLTINVRSNVRWSDGKQLTSEDVAFTYDLLRRFPALNTQGFPLAGTGTAGSHTAVLRFTEPAFQIMWWRVPIVPKHLWEKVSDPVTFTNANPVGSGPYRLKTFTPQVITLERNPHYWQKNQPVMKTVQYISFESTSSMVAGLRAGDLDWIGPSSIDPRPIAKHDPSGIGYSVTKPSPAVIVLMPNLTRYPLDQPVVRKAISLALDRQKVTEIGLSRQNEPVQSPTGLDIETRSDVLAPEYRELRYGPGDPAEAARVLEVAGYRRGPNGIFRSPRGKPLSFELMLPTTNPYADLVRAAQVMTQQLRAAGIEIKVRAKAQVAWRTDTGLGNFDLTMRPLGGTLSVYDLFDRIFNQKLLLPAGKKVERNYERYKNPAAGQSLRLYASSPPDSAGEKQALAELQRLMVEDVPVIPMFFSAGVSLWRTDKVTGFPSESDPYAVPLPNADNSEIVLARLRPAPARN
ncbi:ABC transporter substrate-binding protein [Actinopolymorpha alba]|uniref:ABC transporter substrate-binding protein n=1 Tax=Actinopolymorpha alba TaxID=533267 RepID=UPI0003A5FF5E|nr:ABC transporter substrate-binding protein [Actinopolymorpha alba]